ncbi:hypothetical protein TNIN_1001 [Trichonephila inaurata madagascariensis]|uniref:Uncharacterized protein n=1 Tax=Trichonephila inaurata madagascariensis TaxID=2747483 RepID=A0A8X6X363_9ARAC|nr:hypothetical protein TNIN_1001 [Trichonephila inaurata madagascariensis]
MNNCQRGTEQTDGDFIVVWAMITCEEVKRHKKNAPIYIEVGIIIKDSDGCQVQEHQKLPRHPCVDLETGHALMTEPDLTHGDLHKEGCLVPAQSNNLLKKPVKLTACLRYK